MDGGLHFLDGDVMLRMVYRTSAADMAGAAKLSGIAMTRLKAGS